MNTQDQAGITVDTIKQLRESKGAVSFKGKIKVEVFNPAEESALLQSIKVSDETGVIVFKFPTALWRASADTQQGREYKVDGISGSIVTNKKSGSKSFRVANKVNWTLVQDQQEVPQVTPTIPKPKRAVGESDETIRYMMREKCHVMRIVEEVLIGEGMHENWNAKIPEFATSIMIGLERSAKNKLILPAYDEPEDEEDEEPEKRESVTLKELFASLKKKMNSLKGKEWYSFETKKGTLSEIACTDPFELANWYWTNKSLGKETTDKKVKKLISNIEAMINDTGFFFVAEAIAFDVMAVAPSGSEETDYEIAEKIIAGHFAGKSLEDLGEAWFGQTPKAKKKIITAYAA